MMRNFEQLFNDMIKASENDEGLSVDEKEVSILFNTFANIIKRQGAEIKQLKKELEFYADEDNYEFELDISTSDIDVKSEILTDYGDKARQALKGAKGNE